MSIFSFLRRSQRQDTSDILDQPVEGDLISTLSPQTDPAALYYSSAAREAICSMTSTVPMWVLPPPRGTRVVSAESSFPDPEGMLRWSDLMSCSDLQLWADDLLRLRLDAGEGYSYESFGSNNWVIFRLIAPTGIEVPSSGQHKLHISIQRDPDNLSRAFDVAFTTLLAHRIACFKFVDRQLLGKTGGNPDGKELVIFLHPLSEGPEGDPAFWLQTFLPQLISAFQRAGVVPGSPSLADCPYPGGSGYVWARQSYNILDRYVDADALAEMGFTAEESAALSADTFLRGEAIAGGDSADIPVDRSPQEPYRWSVRSVPSSERITVYFRNSFVNSLLRVIRDGEDSRPAIVLVTLGAQDFDHLSPLVQTIADVFFPNFDLASDRWTNGRRKDVIYHLRNSLRQAAALAADLQAYLEVAHPSLAIHNFATLHVAFNSDAGVVDLSTLDIGEIVPAYYHAFLRPFIERLKAQGDVSRHGIKQLLKTQLFASVEAETQFVDAVVKCTLRTTSEDSPQIYSRTPIYRGGLSEADVDALLAIVKLRSPPLG